MTSKVLMIPLVAVMALTTSTSAFASAPGSSINRSKHAGPYTLVLRIGPAERMTMSGMNGEKMMGGEKARCSMNQGMKMNVPQSMGMAACNHHVELHVFKSGKVVHGAHVTIRMYCIKMHMNVWVPIMTMMKPMTPGDYHYGNNVHAPKGIYTIFVSVNGVHTSFKTVHLRS